MKKPFRKTLIIVGILYLIYILLGETNVLKRYNLSTTSNEPGIGLNSKIFASNLVDFENGDFVCYKQNDESFGDVIWVHRLFGKSGDVVEIKNGILYVNDVNVDENLELKHLYIIEPNEFQNLVDKKIIDKEDITYQSSDKVFIFLIDKIAEQNGLSSKIKLEPKNNTDKNISEIYNEDWNVDNFGPLKIPNGKCFVIGDNRHNSRDARYVGLINETDIVGTVIQK